MTNQIADAFRDIEGLTLKFQPPVYGRKNEA